MKKMVVRIVLGLVALVIVGLVVAFFYLDTIVKKGVETVGPAIAKVDVKVQNVSLSPFSGRGELKGLLVGNPPDFKTPSAIQMGSVAVELVPGSVMSDKIIVRSVRVTGPEITLETGLKGNNLNKILENVQGTTGGSQPQSKEEQQAKSRKLQVDDILITGGKVNVSATMLGGKSVPVPLPEIHLTKLGDGPEGITPAELTEKILRAVVEGSAKSAASAVGNVGKEAAEGIQKVGAGAVDQAGKALQGVGGLFKKKSE